MRRLLGDIEAGRIDVIVVYKIDRLSRSLMDFARLVEGLDAHGVTFVSVTQSFNTTTSMGRLTLNILLSFAQFEREVIGERIRDKFAASRARGMWMGGKVPLGYDVLRPQAGDQRGRGRDGVRRVFEGFAELGSGTALARVLQHEGAGPARRAGRSTRATSTSCCTTAPTWARRHTRGRSIRGGHQAIVIARAMGPGARDAGRESAGSRATGTATRARLC